LPPSLFLIQRFYPTNCGQDLSLQSSISYFKNASQRRKAKAGVMGLEGLARLAAPLFANNDAEATTLLEVRQWTK
jgi:hypothetical protein